MGVLGHERWILREAYLRADEALEFLSAELAKDEQVWIGDTVRYYREFDQNEYPGKAINEIETHLATKPLGIFENSNVVRALAQVLYTIHATGEHLSTLNHQAESAVTEVRYISQTPVPEEGRSRDDRQQGSGRPLPIPQDVPTQRGHHIGKHPSSKDPLPRDG